ncbi:mevalonate kinase [Chloroflexota bacterium]
MECACEFTICWRQTGNKQSGRNYGGYVISTSSAPGKLMLFGEHAVLQGYPCLVTSVDLRYQVSIATIKDPVISIQTPQLENRCEYFSISIEDLSKDSLKQDETKFVLAVLQEMVQRSGYRKGLRIQTNGPINSYGLGSSSAISVASVHAFAELFSMQLSLEDVFQTAYEAVLKVQKTGSGFDVAAAIYGGTIRYQIGKAIQKLNVDRMPLVIGFSGKKVSTVDLVDNVEKSKKRNPEVYKTFFQAIGEITETAQNALLEEDWRGLGRLADRNQEVLENMCVSAPALERSITAAKKAGAFGAKLSGAGGGDCMFAICNGSKIDVVEEALERAGTEIMHFDTNCEGVRQELFDPKYE